MVLSDNDIKSCIKNGDIICKPFNEKNLGSSSYDVTLGSNYYEWSNNDIDFYNPYNKEHVQKFWNLKKSQKCTEEQVKLYGCKPGSEIIIIKPRQTILGHTIEFIGGVNNITTKMQARSSYGRNCITVCKCAGWGDVSYINRWCMEIENCSPYPIILTVGERIAQIAFLKTGIVDKIYSGSYQKEYDISKLEEEWNPEMMLPKLNYD